MTSPDPALEGPRIEAILTALLQSLGNDSDQVARTLAADGAKGMPRKSCACPVFHWLLKAAGRHAPDGMRIVVDDVVTHAVDLRFWREEDRYVCWSIPTPPPVAEFIRRFDTGTEYPDLIEIYEM